MNKLLTLILLGLLFKSYSQKFEPISPPDYIRTIQLFNPVTQNQSPFIGQNEYFVLSFDDIKSTYQRYHYFIKHYDRNWEASNLFESEYTNGYFTDDIITYQPSFNTLQNYVHYEMKFPNARMQPKLSGNYALFVYASDKKKPLFAVRFALFEDTTLIGIQESILTKSNTQPNQRLQVIAESNSQFNLNDNIRQTTLSLVKNNDWNQSITQIAPQFTFNNRLEFKQIELTFNGGNEYYWFDTKNVELKGLTTYAIVQNDLYNAYLYTDEAYPTIYNYNPDVNGAFYIRRNDQGFEREAPTNADYLEVYFSINAPLMEKKKVYVVGAFNQYERNHYNEMRYNVTEGVYEVKILLKQGYYNYQYVIEDEKGNLDFSLNGNFWQTENLYTALLYHRSFTQNYDRLIGLDEMSSLNNEN